MPDVYHRFPALRQLSEGPFSALLGLTVDSAQPGKVTVRMPFHERLLNYGPPDVPIHGGAIASLADFAACAAVWTLPATQRSATISLTVNYSAPAVQKYFTVARIEGVGLKLRSGSASGTGPSLSSRRCQLVYQTIAPTPASNRMTLNIDQPRMDPAGSFPTSGSAGQFWV